MSDWNHDLNPVPAEANFYLQKFRDLSESHGNPVEDLTEIMTECYDLLVEMTKNYKPAGNTRHDSSVSRTTSLLASWPSRELDNLRESVSLERKRPSHAPPPPPSASIVFEDPDAEKQSAIEEKLAVLDVNSGQDDVAPSTAAVSRTSTARVAAPRNSKNNDYFLKLKEDEAVAKKKQEEEEARMKPEQRLKLQEERRLAEEHEKSKTSHLSSLGSKFMPSMKKTSTGEVMLERGGAGRGRGGRGRGGH